MKRTIFIFTVILLLTASLNESYAQKRKTKWLDGTWTGLGFQSNALSQNVWPIKLTYDYKSGSFVINYKSFPCSGYWKLQDASRHKAGFIEYITDGKDRCQDGNLVIVTKIDEEYITVSYFAPEYFDGVIAYSTLRRENSEDKK